MKAEKTVLCVHDGTGLNYSSLVDCQGLGPIGTTQTGAVSKGLHLHSTLALTTTGVPLGVLQALCTAPEPAGKEKQKKSADIPIEERKTFSWIKGIPDGMAVKAQMPHTRIVPVLGREADFFEWFDEQRQHGSRIELLVRAKHARVTIGEHKLLETVKQSPVKSTFEIVVSRHSARAKKSKKKARAKRPARVAKVSLRYRRLERTSPDHHKDKEGVSLSVVHVREYKPPKWVKRLEWFLLTTIPIASTEDAFQLCKRVLITLANRRLAPRIKIRLQYRGIVS